MVNKVSVVLMAQMLNFFLLFYNQSTLFSIKSRSEQKMYCTILRKESINTDSQQFYQCHRTNTFHLNSLNTNNITTYDFGNPAPGFSFSFEKKLLNAL